MALTAAILGCLSVPLLTAQSVPPFFSGVFPPFNCSGPNCPPPLPAFNDSAFQFPFGFNDSAFQFLPGFNDSAFQFSPDFSESAFKLPPGFNDSAFQFPDGFNASAFQFPPGFNDRSFPFFPSFNNSFPNLDKVPNCANGECQVSSNLINVADPKGFNGTFPFPFPNFGADSFKFPPGSMKRLPPFGRFPLPPIAAGR